MHAHGGSAHMKETISLSRCHLCVRVIPLSRWQLNWPTNKKDGVANAAYIKL